VCYNFDKLDEWDAPFLKEEELDGRSAHSGVIIGLADESLSRCKELLVEVLRLRLFQGIPLECGRESTGLGSLRLRGEESLEEQGLKLDHARLLLLLDRLFWDLEFGQGHGDYVVVSGKAGNLFKDAYLILLKLDFGERRR